MVYGVRRPTPQLLPRSQSVHMHAECSLCSLFLVHFLNTPHDPKELISFLYLIEIRKIYSVYPIFYM